MIAASSSRVLSVHTMDSLADDLMQIIFVHSKNLLAALAAFQKLNPKSEFKSKFDYQIWERICLEIRELSDFQFESFVFEKFWKLTKTPKQLIMRLEDSKLVEELGEGTLWSSSQVLLILRFVKEFLEEFVCKNLMAFARIDLEKIETFFLYARAYWIYRAL